MVEAIRRRVALRAICRPVSGVLLGLSLGIACENPHAVAAPDGVNAQRPHVAFDARFTVSADASAQVIVRYARRDGSAQELARRTFPISPAQGNSQDLTLTVDIAGCLADDQRVGATAGGCATTLELILSRGSNELDRVTRPLTLLPGQDAVVSDGIVLSEVDRVALQISPSPLPAASARLELNESASVVAVPLDRTGAVIAGRTATWSGTSGLRLSSISGASISVTMGATGTQSLRATIGERSATLTLEGVPETARRIDVAPANRQAFTGDTVRYSATAFSVSNAVVSGTFRFAASGGLPITADGVLVATGAPGTYTVQASAPVGRDGATITGQTSLTVLSRPVLRATPPSVALSVPLNSVGVSGFTRVDEVNGGSLTGLAATVVRGGISAALDVATTPATLTVRTIAALPAGTVDSALVRISSSTPGVRTLDIPVSIRALDAPQITASTSSVDLGNLDQNAVSAETVVRLDGTTGYTFTGVQRLIAAGGDWLSADLDATTLPTTLRLRARSGSLAVGTYRTTVTVSAASPAGTRPLTIPVSVVVGPPVLQLSTSTIDLGTIDSGSVLAPVGVSVTSTRPVQGLSATVTYGAGSPLVNWLGAVTLGASTPTSLSLPLNVAPLAPGTYTATVVVAATTPTGVVPVSVQVTLAIRRPLVLQSQFASINLGVVDSLSGGPAVITAISTSSGVTATGLTAEVDYGSDPVRGLLSVSLNSTSTTASLTVQVNPSSVPARTYAVAIVVRAAGPGNIAPLRIPVTVRTVSQDELIVVNAPTTTIDVFRLATASRTVSVQSLLSRVATLNTPLIQYDDPQTGGWLSVTLNSPTTPATATLNFTAGAGSRSRGAYGATITFSSSSPRTRSVSIRVIFRIVAQLTTTTPTLDFGIMPRQAVNTLNLPIGILSTNDTASFAARIEYPPGEGGWLSLGDVGFYAPQTFGVTASAGNLANGVYTARIILTPLDPYVFGLIINVRMTVGPVTSVWQTSLAQTSIFTAGTCAGGVRLANVVVTVGAQADVVNVWNVTNASLSVVEQYQGGGCPVPLTLTYSSPTAPGIDPNCPPIANYGCFIHNLPYSGPTVPSGGGTAQLVWTQGALNVTGSVPQLPSGFRFTVSRNGYTVGGTFGALQRIQ